jgi:hypothetical protein
MNDDLIIFWKEAAILHFDISWNSSGEFEETTRTFGNIL